MAEYGGAPAVPPAQGRDCQSFSSEEGESRSSGGGGGGIGSATADKRSGRNNNNTGPIEIGKKPRGRPPGSKNKPKPPLVVTRDSQNAMRPHVLELSAGSDVVDTVSQFARRHNIGLCVLSATGTVANVTLRYPTSHSTLTIHGRFDILSLTGTCLPSTSNPTPFNFTISLAGAQGQVIGGAVAGTLTAAGPVILIAASFINPSFHRLPSEDDEQTPPTTTTTTQQQQQPNASTAELDPPCTMSIYSSVSPINCQLSPTDVLPWPPNTRSPY